MPESTRFASTIAQFYGHLFKLGVACAILAIILYLFGLTAVAGVIGWLAVVSGGLGIVLAGVASSADE